MASSRFSQARAKLADCAVHGPGSGAELLLVEGDSARDSVLAVRDARTQAVLPLQGKPLNAWVATPQKVASHVLYRQLADAMGLAGPTGADLRPGEAALRYERIVLLFDPDADGIHIGALVSLYFARWLPSLLADGALWLARAPMFSLVPVGAGGEAVAPETQALHPAHCRDLSARLRALPGAADVRVRAYRGLGSIAPQVLHQWCLDPATRTAHAVDAAHVQAIAAAFGAGDDAARRP